MFNQNSNSFRNYLSFAVEDHRIRYFQIIFVQKHFKSPERVTFL